MGIDSGYGIGSIKPGVCTSTTRPASPFVGQTIFETDTKRHAIYDGSNWITQNGCQLITSVSLSGSSVSVNNCFSSTYDNYLILCGDMVLNNSTGRDIGFRLRASGTDSTASVYSREIVGAYTTAVFSGANGADTLHYLNAVVDNNLRILFKLDVYNPYAATPTGMQSTSFGYRNAAGQQWWSHSTFHTANTSYDGFTIYCTAQSFTSGTVYVYGMSKV